MQPHDVNVPLRDVVDACVAIDAIVTGHSATQFETDDTLRSAVERKFIIIGEALRNALVANPDVESGITDARKIIDFKNVLIHAYSLVDAVRVWSFVQDKLPLLLSEVRALLPPQ